MSKGSKNLVVTLSPSSQLSLALGVTLMAVPHSVWVIVSHQVTW